MKATIAEVKKNFCSLDRVKKSETAVQLVPIPKKGKRHPVAYDDPRLYMGINLEEHILSQ